MIVTEAQWLTGPFVMGELTAVNKGWSWVVELGARTLIWSAGLSRLSLKCISKERATVTVWDGKASPSPASGGGGQGCGGLSVPAPWAAAGGSGNTACARSCTRAAEGSYPSAPSLVRGGEP